MHNFPIWHGVKYLPNHLNKLTCNDDVVTHLKLFLPEKQAIKLYDHEVG